MLRGHYVFKVIVSVDDAQLFRYITVVPDILPLTPSKKPVATPFQPDFQKIGAANSPNFRD